MYQPARAGRRCTPSSYMAFWTFEMASICLGPKTEVSSTQRLVMRHMSESKANRMAAFCQRSHQGCPGGEKAGKKMRPPLRWSPHIGIRGAPQPPGSSCKPTPLAPRHTSSPRRARGETDRQAAWLATPAKPVMHRGMQKGWQVLGAGCCQKRGRPSTALEIAPRDAGLAAKGPCGRTGAVESLANMSVMGPNEPPPWLVWLVNQPMGLSVNPAPRSLASHADDAMVWGQAVWLALPRPSRTQRLSWIL
ncbi:hypothetical protein GQ53DRAFT_456917 [Thozetella sp. PMI_491]|nr:hypothetical protein GQ53DRAFT_456917 [Thozetella sp. PMI_491]